MKMKILFLGYGRKETRLIDVLEAADCEVTCWEDEVSDLSGYDLVVSFGYGHILKDEVLKTAERPVLGLNIGYLPYNRGAHPCVWSWLEGTPSGVTIHEMDEGVDTGRIIVQEVCRLDSKGKRFYDSYSMLRERVEELFVKHLNVLLAGNYSSRCQVGDGSYHVEKDLPTWITGREMMIEQAKRRYRDELLS